MYVLYCDIDGGAVPGGHAGGIYLCRVLPSYAARISFQKWRREIALRLPRENIITIIDVRLKREASFGGGGGGGVTMRDSHISR